MKPALLTIDKVYINARFLLRQPASTYIRNEGLHFNDAAYCLDALDWIPAGSVVSLPYGDDPDECIDALGIVQRGG